MSQLSGTAKKFATEAHASIDQRRRYTNEPYIVHPAEVVAILTNFSDKPPTDTMIAAAWLHDVVEDTPVSLAQIREQFGPRIAELVDQLTEVSKPEDGCRAVRKAMDRAHTALASPEAKSIKLADVISNTARIADQDPKFAAVYMREKRELLKVLKHGDAGLFRLATYIIDKYFATHAEVEEQMQLALA